MRWFAVIPCLTLLGCAAAKEQAVKDAMYKIYNQGDLSIVDAAYEPELANEIKRFVRDNRELYPDIKVSIVDSVIKGNRYVTRWQVNGTHRDLGEAVTLDGVSVRTREDGVFVEEALYYDMKQVFDQLGFRVIPPEGVSPFDGVEAAAGTGATETKALAAWPDGMMETHGAAAIAEALGQAAKAAGASASEPDCARYPCIVVLEMPVEGAAEAVGKGLNVLSKQGFADPWRWPVMKADTAHAVLAVTAKGMDPARVDELQGRMQAAVDSLIE